MPKTFCFGEFDFDLARAVLDQLVEAFDHLKVGRLEPSLIADMPVNQGVYQLFLAGSLVYIGKADDGVRKRLERHYRALSSRTNIDISAVGFKALFLHKNWTTWATEDALIRHYGSTALWNSSGFGSNDPGRRRDETAEENTFNSRYPINPDIACDWVKPGIHSALNALQELKECLPYLLRFQRVTAKSNMAEDRLAERQLRETSVTLSAGLSVRHFVRSIAS